MRRVRVRVSPEETCSSGEKLSRVGQKGVDCTGLVSDKGVARKRLRMRRGRTVGPTLKQAVKAYPLRVDYQTCSKSNIWYIYIWLLFAP